MSKLEAEYSSRRVPAMHFLDGDFKLLDHAVTDEAGTANLCGVGNWFTVRVDWVDEFLGCWG